ncbi:hypothetical protein EDC18_103184 [Natranaerovirga pectinivora]|uniref:ABC-2 family transporter n=1 Tax=Natranaerovirga pectinivora TaxID=682400 RepID=A0A4R3MPE8_9FIRM|nr:hypothetical protein [Natranaerovirga pectinivora]TCT15479.1 hypothetical protein EDC18_103184 [Natranaerovirga pectinivora]
MNFKSNIKSAKYLGFSFKNSIGIFYLIVVGLALLASFSTARVVSAGGQANSGGFESATVIFLFIAGLTFKEDFKFLIANNVTRKKFFVSNNLAYIGVAVFMTSVDLILGFSYNLIGPYHSMFGQIYTTNALGINFLWAFSLNLLALHAGWFITLLYYRANHIMKLIVCVAPVALFFFMMYLLRTFPVLSDFVQFILGIEMPTFNPYTPVGTFLIGAFILSCLSFVVIRKMPLND